MSFPSTIQAITIPKNGDYDVIEKTTQPFPKVDRGDIVIKVQFGGVNFIDTYFRKGLYPSASFPAIIGQEISGSIVALPTDPSVLSDPDYVQRSFKLGHNIVAIRPGSFAEYVSIPWSAVYPIPDGVSPLTATAGLLQGTTAVSFMEEAYEVKKGDVLLIHTVAGGLGLLMCQYAKSKGAIVIGTTSTEEKAKLAKEHGSDHVILYTKEDTVKVVLELTKGEGVNAIFDGVGKDTFEKDFDMIKRKGTIVSLGNASGAVPPFAPLKLSEKNVKIVRPTVMNYLATPAEKMYYSNLVFRLIGDGTLKVSVWKQYPFTAEGVVNSQKDLTGGKTSGKLVINIAGEN